jgi:hypothetical protein
LPKAQYGDKGQKLMVMPQVANREVANMAKVDNRRISKLKIAVYLLGVAAIEYVVTFSGTFKSQ